MSEQRTTARPPVTLITGATSGIGKETARALARKGHHLVLACRNPAKAEAVWRELSAEPGAGEIELVELDVADFASVRRAADAIRARHAHIDVLINNAGAVFMERQTTPSGIEMTMATNHFGPYLFTRLLLDRVLDAPAGRILFVASMVHRIGQIALDDLDYTRRRYWVMRGYADSKLANVLTANKLARELKGSTVTVNSLHPGGVATNIWPERNAVERAFSALVKRFSSSEADGARTSIYLATSPEVAGVSGAYFENCRAKMPSRKARDPVLQDRLWDVSAQMTGYTD